MSVFSTSNIITGPDSQLCYIVSYFIYSSNELKIQTENVMPGLNYTVKLVVMSTNREYNSLDMTTSVKSNAM